MDWSLSDVGASDPCFEAGQKASIDDHGKQRVRRHGAVFRSPCSVSCRLLGVRCSLGQVKRLLLPWVEPIHRFITHVESGAMGTTSRQWSSIQNRSVASLWSPYDPLHHASVGGARMSSSFSRGTSSLKQW
ncbi:MAG: hypothetical protein OXC92_01800 [Flavobacteriaceae bacterium]|nr:hypothetical protein [Flavobacteriaceae bacterium]